jgi:predicted RNA-binding Zn-ribbon protein involved in translation (DUF1610 family)
MNDVVGRILINCPSTGDPVETVLRLRPSAFEALKGEYRFRCPKCGQVHVWHREDAWLEALGPRHM